MLQKIEVHRGEGEERLTTKRIAGNKFIIVSQNKKKERTERKNKKGKSSNFSSSYISISGVFKCIRDNIFVHYK